MVQMEEEEQHWPDSHGLPEHHAAMPAAGYDDHNGHHGHTYYPPAHAAIPRSQAPDPGSVNNPIVYHPAPTQAYGAMAPAYHATHVAYPILPTYHHPYAVLQPPASMVQSQQYRQYLGTRNTYTVPPGIYAGPGAPPPYEFATPTPNNAWIGRTNAQVNHDNMQMAQAEGAWDPRAVAPVNVSDNQMMWVYEPDGRYVLWPFCTIKGFPGEWKQDPRYDSAWYFVRQKEAPAV